jgi:hypothetical protein
MIFTRRFGALRARRVFPSVTEQDEQLKSYYDDVLARMEEDLQQQGSSTGSDTGESAA